MMSFDVPSSKVQRRGSNKVFISTNGPFSLALVDNHALYGNMLVRLHLCLWCVVHSFDILWSCKETPTFSNSAHRDASIYPPPPWHFPPNETICLSNSGHKVKTQQTSKQPGAVRMKVRAVPMHGTGI